MAPIRDVFFGRLGLPTVDDSIGELLGSEVQATGEASAVGQSRVKSFTLAFPVHGDHGGGGDPDPYYVGQRMRRQLRSLMQNHPYRLAGIYVQYAFDPERNGWIVAATGTLSDADGGVTLAQYKMTLDSAFLVGSRSTHRDGFRLDIMDLRSNLATLDYLEQVVNAGAWFASLPNLPLISLPTGAYDPAVRALPVKTGQRSGSDGTFLVVPGRSNADVISWNRAGADFNKGDVVLYDRRGHLGPFGVGGAYDIAPLPADLQTAYGWEEVYGPDWPYNWLTSGQPVDVPVLMNSMCRVRFDATNTDGLIVDAWSGTTWVEQGKVTFSRYDGSSGGAGRTTLDTWAGAAVEEYTPERAVVRLNMTSSTDPYARERIYITLQRGWLGPRIEVYNADGAGGTLAAVGSDIYFSTGADTNDAAFVVDATGLATISTAASGSALFAGSPQQLGAATFNGENWVAMLRAGAGAQVGLVVVQPSVAKYAGSSALAYGSNRNYMLLRIAAGGYLSARLGLPQTVADQELEAESFRNGSSGTAGTVSDATASGGSAVRDTQGTATAPTLLKGTSTLAGNVKYRVAARVKADGGAVGKFQAVLGGTSGPVVAASPPAWTWVDLGEVTTGATGPGQIAVYGFGGTVVGQIAAPTSLAGTPSALGGQLSGGTLYYKVTALKGQGETTGSNEATVTVPTNLPAPSSPAAVASNTGGVLPNGAYFYKVTAVNQQGETVGSSEVSGTIGGQLTTPTGLAATAFGAGGTMTGGTTYYKVTAVNMQGETLASSEVSSTIANTLSAPAGMQAALAVSGGSLPGATYYYKVTALNANGETVGSAEVSQAINPLSAPGSPTATLQNTPGATLTAGQAYFYKVTAINAAGETVGSTEVSSTASAALATPTGVTATPNSTGGALANNTQFFYKVTAQNALGETVGSAEVSATTPAPTGTTSVGPRFATSGATDASSGSNSPWTTPGAVTADDGTYASNSPGGRQSPYLRATGYGFTIPAGATIVGIQVDVKVGADRSGASLRDVRLIVGGSAVGTNKSPSTGISNAAPAYISFGSASDLWGLTPSAADINGSAFGVGVQVIANAATINVDAIRVTVWYTAINIASVTLGWSAVSGATGYKIYRATSSGGQSSSPALVANVSGGATTGYTDTAASPSTGAVPSANTSAGNAVALAWAPVSGATGYKVYRALTTNGESAATSLLATLSGSGTTSYVDTGTATTAGSVPSSNTTGGSGAIALQWAAVSGATGYKVYRATSSGGQSGANSFIASLGASASGYTDTGATAFAGSVPGSNTATITTGSVSLAWNAVPGAAAYNVYRSGTAGGESGATSLLAANIANPAYTDIGTATTTGSVPGANTANLNTGSIALTWASVVGAASYKVYRAGSSGGQSGATSLLASGVTASAYTDDGSATLSTGSVPSSNTATVLTGSVGLTWAAVSGATGYNIYRATSAGAEGTTPAFVGSVGAVTSFTDQGGAPSTGAVPSSNSTGGQGVYIDLVKFIKLEDRLRAGAAFDGVRDLGQAQLADVQPGVQRVDNG